MSASQITEYTPLLYIIYYDSAAAPSDASLSKFTVTTAMLLFSDPNTEFYYYNIFEF